MLFIQRYAPANDTEEQKKMDFYQQLQDEVNSKARKDILILMGDFNAKISSVNTGKELVMGKEGLGTIM